MTVEPRAHRRTSQPPPEGAPPFPNATIGRDADLAALDRVFAEGERFVTLTGAGGMGKTRLALEYAHRQRSLGADVVFCDMTDVRDARAFAAIMAGALGITLASGASDEPLPLLGRALAARGDVLVVLDNLEQVIDPAAAAVSQWMDLAPSVRWLATSRERVRHAAECVYELQPLDAKSAASLFVARALRVPRSFDPNAAESAAVAEIVRQLDAIPLAVELAAARMDVVGPATLLERLTRSPKILVGVARGLPARQTSLTTTIRWSWDLLEPHAQNALAQLSVFRGGFDLAAAEAVIGPAPGPIACSVLDVIQLLREKSLLRAEAPRESPETLRYALFVCIRDFALERLDESSATAATQRRHAQYFMCECERMVSRGASPAELDAQRWRAGETANLLAACEFAKTTEPRWAVRIALAVTATELGHMHGPDALALLDSADALCAQLGDAALRSRVLSTRSAYPFFRPAAAPVSDARDAVRLAEQSGDSNALATALEAFGSVAHLGAHQDEAIAALARGLAIREAGHDRAATARMHQTIARFHSLQPESALCRRHAEIALAMSEQLGSRRMLAQARYRLAMADLQDHRLASAAEHARAAVELARDIGDPWLECLALDRLANAVQGRDETAEIEALECALSLAERVGNERAAVVITCNRGLVDFTRRRWAKAYAWFAKADPDVAGLGEMRRWAVALGPAALAMCDRVEEARARFAELRIGAAEGKPDRRYRAAAMVLEGFVDIATRDRAIAAGDDASARNAANAARRKLDDAAADAKVRTDPVVRDLAAALERELGGGALSTGSSEIRREDSALVVHADGWFCVPGGERVDIATRPNMVRLLLALAEHRLVSSASGLTAEQLIAAGWPGEKIRPDAARNRLFVTLNRLKALGLTGFVQSDARRGYSLDPNVELRLLR